MQREEETEPKKERNPPSFRAAYSCMIE